MIVVVFESQIPGFAIGEREVGEADGSLDGRSDCTVGEVCRDDERRCRCVKRKVIRRNKLATCSAISHSFWRWSVNGKSKWR